MRHLKRKIAAAGGRLQSPAQNLTNDEQDVSVQDSLPFTKDSVTTHQEELKKSIVSEGVPQLIKKVSTNKKKIEQDPQTESSSDEQNYVQHRKKSKVSPDLKSAKGATSAKNIIKNYGRALQNFAISNMVVPYIVPLLAQEKVTLKDFRRFFYSKKKQVRSIAGLRNLLLANVNDDHETAAFKRVFQTISIIFIKYFSVNWIFSGKLLNKSAHLKCRFKMLRRIKNPENFTYLKGFL